MKKRVWIPILVVLLVIIVGGVFILYQRSKDQGSDALAESSVKAEEDDSKITLSLRADNTQFVVGAPGEMTLSVSCLDEDEIPESVTIVDDQNQEVATIELDADGNGQTTLNVSAETEYVGTLRAIAGDMTSDKLYYYVQPETKEDMEQTPADVAGNLIFSELPTEFTFSSGVGAWGTVLNLLEDGSFTGSYYDGNMGETGEGYPNGTTYICNFSGKFSAPEQVSEYCYVMQLELLETEGNLNEEYYEDGVRYVISEPYGFDDADVFYIYLPGMPVSEMPTGFLDWATWISGMDEASVMPDGYYGIYNEGGEEGFVGEK